jgi:tetratricopeptide (TPR) repeat protein
MAQDPTRPSTRAADDTLSDRLDSWKDVAAYLQRDVSTVQRWEKREGMPVHRHVHEKQGTVYAFRSELDGWWRGRGVRLGEHEREEPDSTQIPATLTLEDRDPHPHPDLDRHVTSGRRSWTDRPVVLIGMVALGVAVSIVLMRPLRRISDGTSAGISRVSDPGRGGATATEHGRTGKSAVVNPEASDLLLRARYLSVRTTDADNQSAIALLQRAIDLDPSFAAAHAELASAYVTRLAYVTPDETRDLEEKAFSAAQKALSLDPDVPEAYLARGDLLWTNSQRFAHDRAVQEFRRALALNPNSDQAHRRLARVFVHVGFFEEALQHAGLALTINPSNAQALNSRAQALLWMGKDEEALAIFQGMPGPVLPELVEANTAFALLRLGRREEGLAYLRRALQKYPNDLSGNLPAMEAMLLAPSDPMAAQRLIAGIGQRKTANPSHHAAYFAACASARLRHAPQAVQWLRDAAATGFPCYALFARDPNLDPIRSDPQFQAFMAELAKSSASLRRTLFPESQ